MVASKDSSLDVIHFENPAGPMAVMGTRIVEIIKPIYQSKSPHPIAQEGALVS